MRVAGEEGAGAGRSAPFAVPGGGYYELLADKDQGPWWQMFQPGATGWGIMPAFHMPHLCCHEPSGRMSTTDDDGVPILLPAIVEWTSLVDPATGYLFTDLFEQDIDLIGPPVGITNSWWPDDGSKMPYVNLLWPDDLIFLEQEWFAVADGTLGLGGLAMPWQIMPVPEEIARAQRNSMIDQKNHYHMGCLEFSACDIGMEEEHGTIDYFSTDHADGTESDECIYEPYRETCNCGEPPTAEQEYDAFFSTFGRNTLTGADLLEPEMAPLWHYALQQYVLGFGTVYDNFTHLGVPWSTSCWRRLSPFSGWHSLEALHQRLSPGSPSSATPLAS